MSTLFFYFLGMKTLLGIIFALATFLTFLICFSLADEYEDYNDVSMISKKNPSVDATSDPTDDDSSRKKKICMKFLR